MKNNKISSIELLASHCTELLAVSYYTDLHAHRHAHNSKLTINIGRDWF